MAEGEGEGPRKVTGEGWHSRFWLSVPGFEPRPEVALCLSLSIFRELGWRREVGSDVCFGKKGENRASPRFVSHPREVFYMKLGAVQQLRKARDEKGNWPDLALDEFGGSFLVWASGT